MSIKIHNDNKDRKDWRLLEFYMPIEESLTNDKKEFIIRGVAINETTTLNNVKYIAEELEKSAASFRDKPILLDHRNEVLNIVGRTTENVIFNSTFNRIEFEAKIMDDKIKEMIKDGRIGSVSIGAQVENLTEEDDGSMKAIGIRGLEISLVAVPGDSQATLAQAMQEGLYLKEIAKKGDKQLNTETKEMTEEDKKTEVETTPEESKEETTETPEEPKEEVAEEKVQKIDVKVDTTEIAGMKKQISEIAELLKQKKKVKEEAEVEPEESEDETKGEVATETEEKIETLNNRIVEKSRQGFAMYRDYSVEDADTKLNRLVR